MVESINAVMRRIAEIQKRFGLEKTGQHSGLARSFDTEFNEKISGQETLKQTKMTGKNTDINTSEYTKSDLQRLAVDTAGRFNVPSGLVDAIIKTESSYNHTAVSPRGAMGLMQLMPGTAAAMGVRNAFVPRDNLEAGVGILKSLLEKYAWDYKKALAAYNAGSKAVDGYGGVPPYRETMAYVNRVMAEYLKNSQ